MKIKLLPLCIAAACGATLFGLTGCNDGHDGAKGERGLQGQQGEQGPAGHKGVPREALRRLATAPLGAEFTGMFLNSDGTFFLNVQHPDSANTTADQDGMIFDKGTVGVVVGADFNALGDIAELETPIFNSDKEVVMTAVGHYQVLTQQNVALADTNTMGDIIAVDGTTVIKNSNDPDFNGVISDGDSGFYVYTNWEDRPGGMSRIHVDGLDENGYQSIAQEGMLDFTEVKGTWVNCFGTVSPWSTPLTSEELYFDVTAQWYDASAGEPGAVAKYLGYPEDGSGAWPNPYDYGYIVEIGTNDTATASSVANVEVTKRYAMGRFSHENSVVMPDLKTVFLSDDGSGVVFFKFVADTAGDLSAGTLYGAKVTQTNGVNDPAEASLAIKWVELGHGTNAEIETMIRSFDGSVSDAKLISDSQITAWAEAKKNADIDGDGTISTSPFDDDRPAFLESRKAAVALGASGEFRKMEGVNINFGLADTWWNNGAADGAQAYAYIAMSSYDSTMSDGEGDIQLDGTNGKCGLVYRMKLMKNADGLVDVSTMVPAIVGGPYYPDRSVNECNVNNISNPDNLVILNDGRVLIGEDTGNHENNMVWLFDDPAI